MTKITDCNGILWIWDGKRLFCQDAEAEFLEKGIPVEQNGFQCGTLPEAIRLLESNGHGSLSEITLKESVGTKVVKG